MNTGIRFRLIMGNYGWSYERLIASCLYLRWLLTCNLRYGQRPYAFFSVSHYALGPPYCSLARLLPLVLAEPLFPHVVHLSDKLVGRRLRVEILCLCCYNGTNVSITGR